MPTLIVSIKKSLDLHVDENLTVVAQVDRKKVTKRKDILKSTFPAVFVVDFDQSQNSFERASYSYTDLLIKDTELKFE